EGPTVNADDLGWTPVQIGYPGNTCPAGASIVFALQHPDNPDLTFDVSTVLVDPIEGIIRNATAAGDIFQGLQISNPEKPGLNLGHGVFLGAPLRLRLLKRNGIAVPPRTNITIEISKVLSRVTAIDL